MSARKIYAARMATTCLVGVVLFSPLPATRVFVDVYEPRKLPTPSAEVSSQTATSAITAPESSAAANQPETAAQQSPAASAPSAASPSNLPWIVTVAGVLLLWLFTGVIAIGMALRRGTVPDETSVSDDEDDELSANEWRQWLTSLANRIGWRFRMASSRLRIIVLRTTYRLKRRLAALRPSRQAMIRGGCTMFGISLVALSLWGFIHGQILPSFLVMSFGYAVAAGIWLVPLELLEAAAEPATAVALSAPIIKPVSTSSLNVAPVAPSIQINFISEPAVPKKALLETVYHRLDSAHELPALDADTARLLHCVPCGRFFNVRGQGALEVRVIPCPQCGTALKKINGESTVTINIESSSGWAPIVSVLCQECRGLIDVPYASIGRPVACPRCRAEMSMPDVEDSIKQLQRLSSWAQA